MRPILRICSFACAVLLTFGIAPTVSAQAQDITIPAGTDFLYSQPGTVATLPGIGRIPLVGNPVLPGGTDTEVDRLGDADATTGAPISTQLLNLNLMGTGPFSGVSVTLDPAHLADDLGTMSFLVNTPVTPGREVFGTISDSLTVYYLVSVPGMPDVTGVEHFTSFGTWEAFLPAGATEVIDFNIVIDTHIDPTGDVHVVSSFAVPEPSSWILFAIGGLAVPAYAGWRRRQQTGVGR
jgi:hypothetical protein